MVRSYRFVLHRAKALSHLTKIYTDLERPGQFAAASGEADAWEAEPEVDLKILVAGLRCFLTWLNMLVQRGWGGAAASTGSKAESFHNSKTNNTDGSENEPGDRGQQARDLPERSSRLLLSRALYRAAVASWLDPRLVGLAKRQHSGLGLSPETFSFH